MAVRLRLARTGRKHVPHYRVVAAEQSKARDGRFVEILGHFDPANYPESITLNEDRVLDWLNKGAQPSDAVKKLLSAKGLLSK
ncbi:MAG TPA: 30S ribosomal protein S16 [bacterium]|nr:MAG: 30S ribosomal protein S16 [bacterium ADurb.Bin236]HOC92294.1 30S ribosomal protein S16 [bacterium]HOY64808.1 30S ribosomal protein S16 [bacterium]HPN93546.1 30S ribosomal protein S16 [bacterium]